MVYIFLKRQNIISRDGFMEQLKYPQIAQNYIDSGNNEFSLGNYIQALGFYERAYENLERGDLFLEQAQLLKLIADTHEKLREYSKAIEKLKLAMQIYKEHAYINKCNKTKEKIIALKLMRPRYISKPALIIFILSISITLIVVFYLTASDFQLDSENSWILIIILVSLTLFNAVPIFLDYRKKNRKKNENE